MSNLDGLIAKILKDCEEKSKQIIDTAEAKASEMRDAAASDAEKEKERVLSNAALEATRTKEQIVVGKRLEIRNDHLGAKRQIIDKVFELASSKLNNMQESEFWEFLTKSLEGQDLDCEELALPDKYNISIDKVNDFLLGKGKKGNLKASADGRKISGGFVLVKEGIENNNTFEALIDYYREDLESKIIAELF